MWGRNDGAPIIRLTVDQMKYSMVQALSNHTAQMDKDLQHAVEEFCKPENLKLAIKNQAHYEMRQAIERAVKRFFESREVATLMDEVVRDSFARAFGKKEKS